MLPAGVMASPGEIQDIIWPSKKRKVQSTVCLLGCLRNIYIVMGHPWMVLEGWVRNRRRKQETYFSFCMVLVAFDDFLLFLLMQNVN